MTSTPSTPLATGQAPGKIILCGEHAVVYGQPAIAVPLFQRQAQATIFPDQRCLVAAVDLDQLIDVAQAPEDDPFARIVRLVCARLQRPLPAWRIVVQSQIPIAAGLGSGAAIAAAMARALLAAFQADLPPDQLSALVYEVEKIHHGAPSGIDNTVVVYGQPVWFVRGQPPQPFTVAAPLHLLVADTGIASPTRAAVADLRAAWQVAPETFERMFHRAGLVAAQARQAIEAGDLLALGALMDANHSLLVEMGVSSPELDRLCAAALVAGALGAKLSGGGRGGCMIALVEENEAARVQRALEQAGAAQVLLTTVEPDRTASP